MLDCYRQEELERCKRYGRLTGPVGRGGKGSVRTFCDWQMGRRVGGRREVDAKENLGVVAEMPSNRDLLAYHAPDALWRVSVKINHMVSHYCRSGIFLTRESLRFRDTPWSPYPSIFPGAGSTRALDELFTVSRPVSPVRSCLLYTVDWH